MGKKKVFIFEGKDSKTGLGTTTVIPINKIVSIRRESLLVTIIDSAKRQQNFNMLSEEDAKKMVSKIMRKFTGKK